MSDQWEVAGTSPSGTPANQWEVDNAPDRPAAAGPHVDMKTSAVPGIARNAIRDIIPALGTAGGTLGGAAAAGPVGAVAGAGLGAAAGETAAQATERKIFGDGVNPLSKQGLIRTGAAGATGAVLEGASQYLHPVEAAKALIPNKWLNAGRALIGREAIPEIGATSPIVVRPGEGQAYGPKDTVVGAQEKIPVRPGFNTPRVGQQERIPVRPGVNPEAPAAEGDTVSSKVRGPVIVAPEPTSTPVGGPKTAFSLSKSGPLQRSTAMGREGAADIQATREGKPVVYIPKEGTGYPGPRGEAAASAPAVERRAAERPALMSPTEIEAAMKNRGQIRTPFDVTEGANKTITRDVDKLVGPAPGEPAGASGVKTEYKFDQDSGKHEIISRDANGKETGKTVASGSPSTGLTVHFDGTDAGSRGLGHAKARIEALAKQTGAASIKSDASMTAGEKGMWESLQKQYPANIAKKSFADGQVQYTWTLKGK